MLRARSESTTKIATVRGRTGAATGATGHRAPSAGSSGGEGSAVRARRVRGQSADRFEQRRPARPAAAAATSSMAAAAALAGSDGSGGMVHRAVVQPIAKAAPNPSTMPAASSGRMPTNPCKRRNPKSRTARLIGEPQFCIANACPAYIPASTANQAPMSHGARPANGATTASRSSVAAATTHA